MIVSVSPLMRMGAGCDHREVELKKHMLISKVITPYAHAQGGVASMACYLPRWVKVPPAASAWDREAMGGTGGPTPAGPSAACKPHMYNHRKGGR